MDIVVYGAGSLGSLLGGLLARTPEHDVTLVGRDPHVSTVEEEGLRVGGTGTFTVRPDATTRGTGLAGDLALVTVKAFDTEAAARDLATGDFAAACSLQNGMGNEDVLARHLDCPVLAGTTGLGAVLDAPGEVTWNGGGDVVVGPWAPADADASALAEDVGGAFAAAESGEAVESGETVESGEATEAAETDAGAKAEVSVTVEDADGIRRRLWEKLAVNAAVNPTTALARVENGALGDGPAASLVEPVVREVARAASATGVALSQAETVDAVESVVDATAENESSMARDVRRGRRTEIESITGYVVERAEEHDVAVPTNRTLLSLVRAWEAGRGLR